jgi:hypothetical protein
MIMIVMHYFAYNSNLNIFFSSHGFRFLEQSPLYNLYFFVLDGFFCLSLIICGLIFFDLFKKKEV